MCLQFQIDFNMIWFRLNLDGCNKIDKTMNTKELINIRANQAQEINVLLKNATDADTKMLQHVIDYAKMGIKSVFFLNGSAAVTVLTLFTSSSLKIREAFSPLLNSVSLFTYGTIISVICILLAYVIQVLYQKSCMNAHFCIIYQNKLRQLEDQKLFLSNMHKDISSETIDSQLKEIESSSTNINKQLCAANKKASIYNLCGKILTFTCFLMVTFCLLLFTYGVISVQKSFHADSSITINIDDLWNFVSLNIDSGKN